MSATPRRQLVARSVRRQLEALGHSSEWLADQTGLTTQVLAPRLAGDEPFDVDQLQAVAVALDLTINDLI
jgi:hypothetical protein